MKLSRKNVVQSVLAVIPSLAMAAFGLSSLAWLMLTAPTNSTLPTSSSETGENVASTKGSQFGVVIAPWAAGGMVTAAGFGLPIVALRWGGHLVILDSAAQPEARAKLRTAGYFVITTSAPPGCLVKRTSDV